MRHVWLSAAVAASVMMTAPVRGQAARAVWEAGPADMDPDRAPLYFERIEGPTARGRLLVCGDFTRVGATAATGIAIWDGEGWESVTTALRPANAGAPRAVVRCAARFDDGTGEAWYFGGSFTDTTGTIRNIARWRGGALEAVGGGLGTGVTSTQEVRALVVHDDGSGPALYAGGSWNLGSAPRYMARWRGNGWESVGGADFESSVSGLWSERDGEWQGLYAVGGFAWISGVPMRGVARWDGAAWNAMDRGGVMATQILGFDRGDGLGRRIRTPHFVWNGTTWDPDPTMPGWRLSLVRIDGEERVYVSTSLGIERMTPTGYEPVYSASDPARVTGIATEYDPGWGEGLRLIGTTNYSITPSGSHGFTDVAHMMALRGERWTRLNGSAGWSSGAGVFDFGAGPELVASRRDSYGTNVALFRWDFARPWAALTPPTPIGPGNLLRMHRLGDGDGSLYASSGPTSFSLSSWGVSSGLFRWRNGTWEIAGAPAGSAIAQAFTSSSVFDSEVFDDGNGPAIYVCGTFNLPLPDGTIAKRLARWNGNAWSAVGGLNDILGSSYLTDLEVFDDGTGPALYVCGGFYAAGISQSFRSPFARWDGVQWSVELPPWSIYTLGTFAKLRTNQGERLFGMTGNLLLERVSGAWEARIPSLGPGHLTLVRESEGARVPRVPGGTARGLVLGFRNEGTTIQWAHLNSTLRPYLPLAVWDHSRWSYVRVHAGGGWLDRMLIVPRGDHDEIWLTGRFSEINGMPARNLVRLVSVETTCAGDADFSGAVGMEDLAIVLGAFGTATPIAQQDPHPADLDVNEKVDFYDLMIVLGNFGRTCPTQE